MIPKEPQLKSKGDPVVHIRLPKKFVKKAKKFAEKQGLYLGAFLRMQLIGALSQKKTP